MAGVFTLLFLVVGGGLFVSVAAYVSVWRGEGRPCNRWLPLMVLFAIPMAYLVAKVVYEEVIPCATVDATYCDFDSTQYRNLFGWEF